MIFSRKYILIICGIILFPIISYEQKRHVQNSNCSKIKKDDIYGEWEVYKYRRASQAVWSPKEMQKYLNKHILLGKFSTIIFQDTCKLPNYKVSQVDTWEYLYEGYKENSMLGIEADSIAVIGLNCDGYPINTNKNVQNFTADFMVINKNHIIYSHNGLYLYMRRIN